MKTKELREMPVAELERKLGEARRELLSLRIQRAGQQLKNLLKIRVLRREIARTLTIINEKKSKTAEVK